MNRAFVLLSSNQNPETNLQAALDLFRERCTVTRFTPVIETPPVGEIYKDNFLDSVLELETDLTPLAFRETVLLPIENQLGRQKGSPHIPIDLDILLWNQDSFDFGDKPWHVPDRGIVRDVHLAYLLAQLIPDEVHPEDGRTLRAIADSLAHQPLTPRPDVVLR